MTPSEETRQLRVSLIQRRTDELASLREGSFAHAVINLKWVVIEAARLDRLVPWLAVRLNQLLTRKP